MSRPRTLALEEFFNNLDADRNGQVDAKEASAFIANLGGSEYDEPKEVAQGVEAFLQGVDGVDAGREVSVAELDVHLHTVLSGVRVCDWVRHGLGLPQYAEAFRQHAVSALDFPTLLHDNARVLEEEFGVTSPFQKSKVVRAIRLQILGLGKPPSEPQGLDCNATLGPPSGRLAAWELRGAAWTDPLQPPPRAAVAVSWSVPTDMGKPPLHKYVVERAASDGTWHTVHQVDDPEPAAWVDDVPMGALLGPAAAVDRLGGSPTKADSSAPPSAALAGGIVSYRISAWNLYGRSPYGFVACDLTPLAQEQAAQQLLMPPTGYPAPQGSKHPHGEGSVDSATGLVVNRGDAGTGHAASGSPERTGAVATGASAQGSKGQSGGGSSVAQVNSVLLLLLPWVLRLLPVAFWRGLTLRLQHACVVLRSAVARGKQQDLEPEASNWPDPLQSAPGSGPGPFATRSGGQPGPHADLFEGEDLRTSVSTDMQRPTLQAGKERFSAGPGSPDLGTRNSFSPRAFAQHHYAASSPALGEAAALPPLPRLSYVPGQGPKALTATAAAVTAAGSQHHQQFIAGVVLDQNFHRSCSEGMLAPPGPGCSHSRPVLASASGTGASGHRAPQGSAAAYSRSGDGGARARVGDDRQGLRHHHGRSGSVDMGRLSEEPDVQDTQGLLTVQEAEMLAALGPRGAGVGGSGPARDRDKVCAVGCCGRKLDLLHYRDYVRRHYCGRCQQVVCLAHTAYSPHGATGSCGHESRCVCTVCFQQFNRSYQLFLMSRNTLKQTGASGAAASLAAATGSATPGKGSPSGRTGGEGGGAISSGPSKSKSKMLWERAATKLSAVSRFRKGVEGHAGERAGSQGSEHVSAPRAGY